MPLYNNILLSRSKTPSANQANPAASSATPTTSSASLRFLQDHLISKQRAKQTNQNPAKNKQQKNLIDRNQVVSESALHKSLDGDWNLEDEYDPMVPNSYELLLAEHIKAEEKRLAKIRSVKINPSILGILDKLDDDDCGPALTNSSSIGTAIAPPPSLSKTQAATSSDNDNLETVSFNTKPDNVSGLPSAKLSGVAAAPKIVAKMDYRPGQGLGREEKSVCSALEAQKSCVSDKLTIKNQSSQSQDITRGDKDAADMEALNEGDRVTSLLKNSTRVLLLQNMVGSGEVDDDLEAETKEECKKYGEVLRCLIYEIPNKRVPDTEAVRIFVEFKAVESAIKAVSDLNGRYFGGRVVRASFYDLDKFRSYDLGS